MRGDAACLSGRAESGSRGRIVLFARGIRTAVVIGGGGGSSSGGGVSVIDVVVAVGLSLIHI